MAVRSFNLFSSTCVLCRSVVETCKTPNAVRFYSTKKKTNRTNVVVKLIKDVPRWGPKGSFVRVAPGFMRNYLYHSRQARYVVGQELKDLIQSNAKIERNSNFQIEKEEEVKPLRETQDNFYFEPLSPVTSLSPQQSIDLLQTFLPSTLTFERQVNSTALPDPQSKTLTSHPRGSPIYGSVSLADLVSEIKANISHNPEAAQIQLDESNVRIDGVEDGRIRVLGSFQIVIDVGSQQQIQRRVEVKATGQNNADGPLGQVVRSYRRSKETGSSTNSI